MNRLVDWLHVRGSKVKRIQDAQRRQTTKAIASKYNIRLNDKDKEIARLRSERDKDSAAHEEEMNSLRKNHQSAMSRKDREIERLNSEHEEALAEKDQEVQVAKAQLQEAKKSATRRETEANLLKERSITSLDNMSILAGHARGALSDLHHRLAFIQNNIGRLLRSSKNVEDALDTIDETLPDLTSKSATKRIKLLKAK